MDTKNCKIKVLMLPWLAYGHISPYLELAKKFTERNLYIYFCSTPINLISVKKKLNQNHLLSIQLVELHLPSLPDLPPHYHTTNGLPSHLMTTLKDAYDLAIPNFSNILSTLTPDLVIYDFNQSWAPTIASSLNIPAVQFLAAGPAMPCFALHMINYPGKEFPFPEIYFRNMRKLVANRGTYESSSGSDEIEKDKNRFLESMKRSSNMILVKSFTELEGKYMDYLSVLAEKKIVPVGPLVEEPNYKEDEINIGIMEWLDKKDESSTVFVSFGSECFLTNEEIEEVAHGLEHSEVNFIWVVRFPVGKTKKIDEALPEGFLERVGDRGMVVEGWAPQAKILDHSSIGGFVSHCGWSSVMESMKFGVPIIALPMHLDQPLNARVVEGAGVGVEVIKDENGRLKGEEIAQVIRKVVLEKNGEDVRNNARKFCDIIRLKKDKEIDGVVEELLQLCREAREKSGSSIEQ